MTADEWAQARTLFDQLTELPASEREARLAAALAAGAASPAVLAEVMNAHLAGFSKSEWMALRSYLERMLATGDAMRDAD